LDLAVASNVTHALAIFLNDGSGTFTFHEFVTAVDTADATDLAAGDLDNDGDIDLALAHYDGVYACINDGTGSFTSVNSAGISTGTTQAVDIGDIDRDGRLDVVSCQIYSGSIAVRRGNGDGTFSGAIMLSIGTWAEDVMVADLNGDDRDDVIGVNQSNDRVYIFESLGSGVFASGVSYITGNQPSCVAAGDFDNDGRPDLVVASRELGETPALHVLRNLSDTSLCIEIIDEPEITSSKWAGHIAAFHVLAVAEPPVTYQWLRNGVPLTNGTTPAGATIVGADTDTLIINDLTTDDAGTYEVEISTACGSMTSMPSVMTVNTPPVLPAAWDVTVLHPAGALASSGDAIDAFGQYGSITLLNTELGITVSHPAMWSGDAGSFVNLTPAGSAGGQVLAAANGVQVGWWWWPYSCGTQNQLTCYSKQAASWAGTAASHDNKQVSGWEYSQINDTDGLTHVGTKSDDDASGNTFAHAIMWTPPNNFSQDLHPAGTIASKSFGEALDGANQYGFIHTPFPGPYAKAAKWSGTAASYEDMNPAGAFSSFIRCAGDGQQGGTAKFGSDYRSGIWAGSPLTFMELTPACTNSACSINACAGGVQVGAVMGEAMIWATDVNSAVNLHAALPTEYQSSTANDVRIDESGTISVVGSGYNAITQRYEALLWTPGVRVPCPADCAGGSPNGEVNIDDLLAVINAFGP
ncbi:MAG: VCBS repeat-containing protein, partial [Phycisphaerales bacterium]|nr:VCBS repeat-containing protein [Phycisphaerales bacterium]